MADFERSVGDQADGVLEAARSIRAFLPELVGPQARSLDARLAELLNDPSPGGQLAGELADLLETNETTADFLAGVLADTPEHRPPQIQFSAEPMRGVEPLPGTIGPVTASKFACPRGDFVWYRLSVGASAPICPSHGLALVVS